MVTCTVLYVLMCIAITLAKPYFLIDRRAPFSVLFKTIPGWHWASYLIAVGAVMGVGTVVLVSLPSSHICTDLPMIAHILLISVQNSPDVLSNPKTYALALAA